jgi:hypothetical protein
MKQIHKDTYEIRTYNNGILYFVIGRTYKAIGTCGEAKDKEVTGKLKFHESLNELVLVTERGLPCSINEHTLSYL